MHSLTDTEKERYNRQILFWGKDHQVALKRKTVAVIGAGGLGSPVLYYLAGAGVGTIKVYDFDSVQLSNLNRQILHCGNRIGMNKAISARKTLNRFNEQIKIVALQEKMTPENFQEHTEGIDLLIDASDSVETKEALNQSIVEHNLPSVMSALVGCGGYAFVNANDSICWFCLFKRVYSHGRKNNKKIMPFADLPSFGASCGLLGSVIANIAVRRLLGDENQLGNTLFYLPQLWDFHKLMIVDKVFDIAMSEHLKSSISDQQPKFPMGSNFIEKNIIRRDPDCQVCRCRA